MSAEKAKVPRIRSAYDGSRVRVALKCGVGLTRQSAKDECDINLIMARFSKTGMISHVNGGVGLFTDVSRVGDYQGALETVRVAQEMFLKLPSQVRKRFNNDAAAFVDFCSKPENQAEGAELGLWPKVEPAKEPAKKEAPEGGGKPPASP